ncbi:MAG: META domain-containing protein [Bacteroidetes bacterium]|nr:META domain-containing protein [Bacteroidota bacterium]
MQEIRFILLLILLFFSNGCQESSTEPVTKEFLNTLWTLEYFNVDGKITVSPKEQIYNIQFFADSTMKGKSDCNEIFSYYKLSSNYLVLDSLFTTKKGCGEGSMGSIYFDALRITETYKIEKNNLAIFYGNDSKLTFIGE